MPSRPVAASLIGRLPQQTPSSILATDQADNALAFHHPPGHTPIGAVLKQVLALARCGTARGQAPPYAMPPALCGLGTPLLAIGVAGIGTVLVFGEESLPVGCGDDSLVGVLVEATHLGFGATSRLLGAWRAAVERNTSSTANRARVVKVLTDSRSS